MTFLHQHVKSPMDNREQPLFLGISNLVGIDGCDFLQILRPSVRLFIQHNAISRLEKPVRQGQELVLHYCPK